MEYAYKFRIYPSKQQETLILRTFGCARYVYNYYLNQRIQAYKNTGKCFVPLKGWIALFRAVDT